MKATATPESSVIHAKSRSVAKPVAKVRITPEYQHRDRVGESESGGQN